MELDALVEWCLGTGSPLRLITGPGGVGKSRLAGELRERMSDRGWACVVVGDEQEATILAKVRASTGRHVLLVVDYADTRQQVNDLVRQVAADPDGVHVLLIARSAGEWWKRLAVGSPRVRAMVQGAYDGTELSHEPLTSTGPLLRWKHSSVGQRRTSVLHFRRQEPCRGMRQRKTPW